MLEPGLETNEPLVEVYIHTGSDEETMAVQALLDTLDVEQAVRHTLEAVNIRQAVTLTLVISGDAEIQALNRQYRQQDKPTDVLSFPLLEKPLVNGPEEWLWQQTPGEEENELEYVNTEPAFVTPYALSTNLGDIVISWPTMQRQARAAGHPLSHELLFLLCHGVLHLVGYDDQTEAGYTEMVRLQQTILAAMEQKG